MNRDNKIYFLNETHHYYYNALIKKFPIARQDRQYGVACYITSLPEIYEKVSQYITDNPLEWYFDYKIGELDIDLSSGYQKIASAGANLWNGHNDFNLYDSLHTWGNELKEVFFQALKIAVNQ